jgi:hypothetical protein
MAQLDYARMGFTLSVAEAADLLGVDHQEVRHLLLTNDLAGVMVSAGQFAPIAVKLHPDEVRAYGALRATRSQTVDSRNRSRSLRLLHDYLEAFPPVDDYDLATAQGLPLLACSGTELAVHVRLEALVAFHQRVSATGGPVTMSMLSEALTRAGGIRRKGVIAASDRGSGRRQRWGSWWRVPSSLLGSASDADVARQMINGPLEPGEKVRLSREKGDDGVILDAPPLPS